MFNADYRAVLLRWEVLRFLSEELVEVLRPVCQDVLMRCHLVSTTTQLQDNIMDQVSSVRFLKERLEVLDHLRCLGAWNLCQTVGESARRNKPEDTVKQQARHTQWICIRLEANKDPNENCQWLTWPWSYQCTPSYQHHSIGQSITHGMNSFTAAYRQLTIKAYHCMLHDWVLLVSPCDGVFHLQFAMVLTMHWAGTAVQHSCVLSCQWQWLLPCVPWAVCPPWGQSPPPAPPGLWGAGWSCLWQHQ